MNIRTRLTIRFITIVALIIIISGYAIYFFSADYRKEDFYNRLTSKANSTAKLLIEVEEIDAELLRRMETGNPVTLPNEKIKIFDHNNQILYSSDEENEIIINAEILDQIRLDGEVRFVQSQFEVLGFLFTDQYDRFVVIAAATDIYGLKKLTNLRTILFMVFILSILAASISGWIYAGRALKPISNVISQVDEISITKLNYRVDEGNENDEIAQLAKTFNNMLSRLEKAFNVQKNFIANASHELRTPLTSITGQLEVVTMTERKSAEYKNAIKSVLDDIKNLNMLANRLLLLAQASSESSTKQFSLQRIDELLWNAKDELTKRYSKYVIHIDLDSKLEDETLSVSGEAQLLRTVFINLMENGCKYSTNHEVFVFVKPDMNHLTIEFKDNGIGIKEDDLKTIFEPFHRGKNVQQIHGHGIGLSLVERILTMHKGNITIDSKVGIGTSATVKLPYSGNKRLPDLI